MHAADFDNVFQKGQRSADRYFTILFQPNTLNHPRLGFAISKQKVRLAVGRNRLRRLVRESFRRRAASLPPVDMVVLARDATTVGGERRDRHQSRQALGPHREPVHHEPNRE